MKEVYIFGQGSYEVQLGEGYYSQ